MSDPSSHHSLVKKGKDCVAIAKDALDDISNGREKMAIKKLSDLQRDSRFLGDAAEQLAGRLEAVDKYYQNEDAEISRKIGELARKESEVQRQRNEEESRLAAHQSVLRDNQDRLFSAEVRLRDAEHKLKKAQEEERKIELACKAGGAIFGGAPGYVVGAGIASMINSYRSEERDAHDACNRCFRDLNSASSAVNESQERITTVTSQIVILNKNIDCMKLQSRDLQNKISVTRCFIALAKDSVQFWLLFKQFSEHGVDRTALLQKIVTRAAKTRNDKALQSTSDKALQSTSDKALQSKSTQRIANTFIDAWEEMETTAECGGQNHILKIKYRCSRCNVQCSALPHLDGSALVCMECHSKYALKN